MSMNLSKRDINLLLILLAIVILVGAYLGIYSPLVSQTEAVEAEIAELKPRLEQLEGYNSNLKLYQEGIKKNKEEMARQLELYPNDVRSEDQILYATELEKKVGLAVSNISMSQPASVLEMQGVVTDEKGNSAIVPIAANRAVMNLETQLNYQELKNLVKYVNDTKLCTKLDVVSLSYDSSTGELIGNVAISKYFVSGLDSAYHAAKVPSVATGTSNIFGTVTKIPDTTQTTQTNP